MELLDKTTSNKAGIKKTKTNITDEDREKLSDFQQKGELSLVHSFYERMDIKELTEVCNSLFNQLNNTKVPSKTFTFLNNKLEVARDLLKEKKQLEEKIELFKELIIHGLTNIQSLEKYIKEQESQKTNIIEQTTK